MCVQQPAKSMATERSTVLTDCGTTVRPDLEEALLSAVHSFPDSEGSTASGLDSVVLPDDTEAGILDSDSSVVDPDEISVRYFEAEASEHCFH